MKLKKYLTVLAALFFLFQTSFAVAKTQVKNETKKVYGIAGPKLQYHPKKTTSKTYTVKGVRYRTVTTKEAKNYAKQGTATFYHPKFVGQKTSSGEVYNEKLFTAAHKTLPLNSYVLVTNLRNHKQVVVRINDRGPFHSNRIIDLSKAAAKELGMTARGTANVKLDMVIIDRNGNLSGKGGKTLLASRENIEANSSSDKNSSNQFKLTASNIESREKAEKLISELAMSGVKTEITQDGNKFNVHFGPLLDQAKVNSIKLAFSRLHSDNSQLYTYRY
ncbi:septal ring lytic transglycosylase RlpA family protein [Gallibacterium salpingitidis]|uniref:septal ring lytic transglycosylase RlpA family protein n=1 Tax=Gallibacterium salpingitidis TaxID=505341 RepID=UPI00266F431D|nr:septal ring lytic transglycosylase RlpA family protein [Gallibacterium salpingitidis]WKS99834.1 septal ring lytic transglycosylase RlpA family protein [Gallibacterium salpingitidis]